MNKSKLFLTFLLFSSLASSLSMELDRESVAVEVAPLSTEPNEGEESTNSVQAILKLTPNELATFLRYMVINYQGQLADIREKLATLLKKEKNESGTKKDSNAFDRVNLDNNLVNLIIESCPPLLQTKIQSLGMIGQGEVIPRKKKKGHKIFLLGRPGLGKTTLAYAIGQKFGYPVEYHVATCIPNQFQYSGENRLRDILQKYEKVTSPHILCIDELPVLLRQNQNNPRDEEKIASAFWTLLDRCLRNENFILITTGNDSEELPDPIKDRFHGVIYTLTPPDKKMRAKMIAHYLPEGYLTDQEINQVAQWTKGYSSRELEELVDKAHDIANDRVSMNALQLGLIQRFRSYLPRMFYGEYLPTTNQRVTLYDMEQAFKFITKNRYLTGAQKGWARWTLEKLDAFGKNEHTRFYLWPLIQISFQTWMNYKFHQWNIDHQRFLHEDNQRFQSRMQREGQSFQEKLHSESQEFQQKLHNDGLAQQAAAHKEAMDMSRESRMDNLALAFIGLFKDKDLNMDQNKSKDVLRSNLMQRLLGKVDPLVVEEVKGWISADYEQEAGRRITLLQWIILIDRLQGREIIPEEGMADYKQLIGEYLKDK